MNRKLTTMAGQLKGALNSIIKFGDEEFEIIADCFKPEFVKKGEPLLMQGDTCGKFYFVAKGCIRIFFINAKGVEKTRYIMPENHLGTALSSFITRKPSFEQIDAVQDSFLLSISREDFYMLNERLRGWSLFYQRILEMAYSFQNSKIESLMTKTAQERFDQAMKESPALFNVVSNRIMASYLDMSQETLSRLKSK